MPGGAVAFTNARVLTMDPHHPRADTVVAVGGRVAAVGTRELLAARGPGLEVRDLGGRLLVPGFVDAHHHLSIAALHPLWADLDGVGDVEEAGRRLRELAARDTDAAWVRGVGWQELRDGLRLSRHDLDALGIDRPVLVACSTLHRCVVSSAGLDALGIGPATPDPPGGVIERDLTGRPTGVLVERAWSDAHARSVEAVTGDPRDPDARAERWADLVERRARQLLADGVTAVHDAACPPAALAVYRRLAAAGRLPVSVLAMPHPAALLGDPSAPPAALAALPPCGAGDEQVRVGPVKVFADGGIAPAIDAHLGGHHLQLGIRMPDVVAAAERLTAAGHRVAVHAIGNAGLAEALDAARAAARRRPDDDLRFRIEHVMLAGPAQVRELAALGAVGVVQPGFVHHVGRESGGVGFDDATWLPFASLARAGVRLAASSDDPCTFSAPLRCTWHGVTRVSGAGTVFDAEQSLPYDAWLEAWTAGAAHTGGQEHERGRLLPGLRADLVVLDGELDPEHPPTVAETWVAGERVWARPGATPR